MKEAYLIMAHNNWGMVRKLLVSIDHPDNDIYLHINSLVDMPEVESFKKVLSSSKLFLVERNPVYWGDYTFTKVIFLFFKSAFRSDTKYQYFHIVTGADLMIKKVADLKHFLAENLYNNSSSGLKTNYITCHIPSDVTEYFPVAQYNLFIKHWRNSNPIIRKIAKGTALVLNYCQVLLGINRIKTIEMNVYKGDSFFSVSDEFVEYALKYEQWAFEHFGYKTFGADEYVFQTIIMNSKFRNSVYETSTGLDHSNLRHIDFERGTPYVWKICDYNELKSTKDFFARKFDSNLDVEIITKIYEDILK